jgi:uncharacterized protein (DUF1800 family)
LTPPLLIWQHSLATLCGNFAQPGKLKFDCPLISSVSKMRLMNVKFLGIGAMISLCASDLRAVDQNANQQSDVWEMLFQSFGLPSAGDFDGDGYSNAAESRGGTNPRDGTSFPKMGIRFAGNLPIVTWQSLQGKRYAVLASSNLSSFTPTGNTAMGTGDEMALQFPAADGRKFFRLATSDVDTDSDGVNDWEELALGFDPERAQTDRFPESDSQRVIAGITAANTITAAVYEDACSERWPDPAVLVLRRSGGLQPLTVNFSLAGSATRNVDFSTSIAGSTAVFAAGQREVFVEISPIADANDSETTEGVVLTALAGSGYTVGAENSASASISNETATSGPSAKAAARFLIQAAFGPDQDAANDADQIPENVEEVMGIGFSAWIDEQLARPVGTLLPMVQWQIAQPNSEEIYNDKKVNAWWGRAMGVPKLRPDATATQLPDPLRQRVGFALSQIFVIGDRMERLGVEPEGVVGFYDMLLQNSFGNFENLLRDVALQPCMGVYLSHLGNKKSDPIAKTFPDENFAREIMQLFSIGLWMLNPDGSRQLDANNRPIPTYNNTNITEIAKVFTGLMHGQNKDGSNYTRFDDNYNSDFISPMKGWDEFHDLTPKNLLRGATTPLRVASAGNTGTATLTDVNALVKNLFNHPNVGPFIGRLLIQRLTTSNPSPAYIGRVTAAFNATPRGDMGRVVKAILLDPEARDPAKLSDPTFGKLREPFLKIVNFARAFNAASPSGWYYLDAFQLDHVQEPFDSPSVFNFYLPTYSPPGALSQAALVSPELQIVNAASGVTAPNYFWNAINGGLYRWGQPRPDRNVKLNLTQEMLMNVQASDVNDPYPLTPPLNPDPLIRRLDLVLTGGTLTPKSFQIIREALNRIGPGSAYEWPRDRLKLAIYLIVSSPEFAVQH